MWSADSKFIAKYFHRDSPQTIWFGQWLDPSKPEHRSGRNSNENRTFQKICTFWQIVNSTIKRSLIAWLTVSKLSVCGGEIKATISLLLWNRTNLKNSCVFESVNLCCFHHDEIAFTQTTKSICNRFHVISRIRQRCDIESTDANHFWSPDVQCTLWHIRTKTNGRTTDWLSKHLIGFWLRIWFSESESQTAFDSSD